VSSSTRWPVPAHTRTFPERSQVLGGLTPSSGAYSLNAEPASYAVTGVAATVVAARVIDAQPAAYTVTGVAATFARAFSLDSQPGSYTLTGVAVTFERTFSLDSQPGEYTLTGVASTLEYAALAAPPNTSIRAVKAHTRPARQQVSQTISGLTPAVAYELNAEPGAYTLTGVAATFTHNVPDVWDRVVSPNYAHTTPQIEYASRSFYGVEVIAAGYSLDCQPGSFAVAGVAATVVATRVLDAQPAAYTVTGTAATLPVGRFVNAEPGSYALTGVASTTSFFPSIVFNSTVTVQTSIVVSGGTANRAYELPLRGVG
jgi:hypothetical protein